MGFVYFDYFVRLFTLLFLINGGHLVAQLLTTLKYGTALAGTVHDHHRWTISYTKRDL